MNWRREFLRAALFLMDCRIADVDDPIPVARRIGFQG